MTRDVVTALKDEAVLAEIVAFVGLLVFGVGVIRLAPTSIGADPVYAVQQMANQLPTTLPVAVMVAAALAANVLGGAIVLRLMSGEPYRSLAQAILCGLAGAVLADVIVMGVLGSLGLFRLPVLAVVLLLPLFLIARADPLIAPPEQISERPSTWASAPRVGWLIVALVWAAPVVFTLASPIVPWPDVPPNHVAPVEHLRTFGALAALNVAPDAFYGPSRIVLGYQALLGMLATVTDSVAGAAVAQFALALAGLVALAGWSLAQAIGGKAAAFWALLLLPLSVTFFRLDDARAGVLAFPLVALCLWLAIAPLGKDQLRRVLVLGGTVAAAILVHPLIGVYSAGFLALGAVLRPRAHAGLVWPALAVAAVLAIPEFIAAAGLAAPGWTVVLPIPLAVAAGVVLVGLSRRAPFLERWLLPAVCVALLVGLIGVYAFMPRHLGTAWQRLWRDGGFSVIALATVLAVLAWRRRGLEFVAGAIVTAVVAALTVDILPSRQPLAQMLYYEAPKFVYIVPTLMAVAGAAGVAALWSWRRVPLLARAALIGALLMGAAAPIGNLFASDIGLSEHRWAESFSVTLRNTSRGGLYGFPDARLMIDAQQAELVIRLREEIDAGRLSATTPVLQVARSARLWVSTPVAVFTGAIVTMAIPAPEISEHTMGGRLHDINELPAMVGPAFPFVVLEPDGLDPSVRALIVASGYESLFSNGRGELFLLASAN